MGQYGLLHRLQLFRDRGQPPGQNQSTPTVDTHGAVHSTGRRSPLTEAETSRVRRALFGPVDHEENLRFVKQELERGQREAEKRWNYDFVNDRPVNDPDRRYVWESMGTCSRRHIPHISSLTSSSDVAERSGTLKDISSSQEASEEKESVQSENIQSSKPHKYSEKSQLSHFTMSEKILASRPSPLICLPTSKTTSNPSSSDQIKMAKSSGSVSLSAPATANVTPHESPQAGSSNSGSQILPPIEPETATKACDISQSTPTCSVVLSANVANVSSASKQSSSRTTSSLSSQRSRSKSLHGTQKPITGHFRERKRSKSKTKIDSRSLKLQERMAPSQMSMSNFSASSDECASTARARSPTSNNISNDSPEDK